MNLAPIRPDEAPCVLTYGAWPRPARDLQRSVVDRARAGEVDEAAQLLRRSGIELEVLLVDDSSTDGTPEIARATTDASVSGSTS